MSSSGNIVVWLILLVSKFIMISMIEGEPQVPCYFIFGDSVVDNGNNNDLITTAKANYFPYGIDFPTGPKNGRFTNGRNKADFLAELIGFDNFIPPFAIARGPEILKGVNYASGAAGIRDETGYRLGDRISMNRQLLNHQVTILRINSILRNVTAAKSLLNKCLYTVDMGNNDYLNNYLQPKYYPSSLLYTPEKFADVLAQQFSRQLKTLYGYGARKVAVSNIGLLGCLPEETRVFGRNASGCVDFINNYVQLFNDKLKPLIDDLNTNLSGARFTYINITSISLGGPANDFTVFDKPCCIVSDAIAKGQCKEGEIPCSNRNQYIFYDNFHPTEVANLATAKRSYNAFLPTDAHPMDISQLIQTQ
ncbi:GDSL esterase/lipase At1g29670-like [Lycium ferocissimum]|uniref:GDSL esterase/lipase At1g29670-like n=1 Tax=Lycium ferocissimum TaxID=112874 RepID=UPI0028166996|nr:GDSL esterase/lipase At1g29670-like [Lycium ferocissimum]